MFRKVNLEELTLVRWFQILPLAFLRHNFRRWKSTAVKTHNKELVLFGCNFFFFRKTPEKIPNWKTTLGLLHSNVNENVEDNLNL